MEDLAAFLRRCVGERGWSWRALARRAGVDHSTVSRLVRKQLRPSVGLLLALSRALGVPPAELFVRAGLPLPGDGSSWDVLLRMGVPDLPHPSALLAEVRALGERFCTPEGQRELEDGLSSLRPLLRDTPVDGIVSRLQAELGRADAPREIRGLAGGALGYLITRADRIADDTFAVGYVDDLIVLSLALREIERVREEGKTGPDGC